MRIRNGTPLNEVWKDVPMKNSHRDIDYKVVKQIARVWLMT